MKKLSTLLIALSLGYAAHAQIPNADFENWTSFTGYDRPDNWATADSLLSALAPGTHTCDKSTPGVTGTYYVKLTSVTTLLGVIPGIAVSGRISLSGTTPTASGGFAMSSRPANLTGSWQYTPAGSDQGSIAVLLTKWNGTKTDTISLTNYTMSGTVSSWTTFSIPLTYLHGDTPDTARIVLLSGLMTGGTAGSTISIDNLGFTGSVPNGVTNVNNTTSSIDIYPNPASGYANVSYQSNTAGNVHLSVMNISGRSVAEMDFKKIRGANEFPVQVNTLAAGMYFIKVSDDNGVAVKKLFVE